MSVDKSKWKYDYDAGQRYTKFGYVAEFGRAHFTLICPFCNISVKAYVWSLCGGGKICPGCGAMHTNFGSYPKIEKPNHEQEKKRNPDRG